MTLKKYLIQTAYQESIIFTGKIGKISEKRWTSNSSCKFDKVLFKDWIEFH